MAENESRKVALPAEMKKKQHEIEVQKYIEDGYSFLRAKKR